ncbi:MAG TPA: chemotaxis response regulator protein-glutamate methylesterase [Methylophilaceae bacterium]
MSQINVMLVDDSAYMRGMLRSIINAQNDIVVSGSCSTANEAVQSMQQKLPDVILINLEMAGMSDLGLLDHLMKFQEMPVIIMSDETMHTHDITMKALKMGVIGFAGKPKVDSTLTGYGGALCDIIRTAASSKALNSPSRKSAAGTPEKDVPQALPMLKRPLIASEKLLVLGASTGGTEAIKDVLMRLPVDSPGIVITQHMPEGFTGSFALRLDHLCQISVKEAEHGERILPGHAYIAPGHSHLLINRRDNQFFCELSQAPPVNRHRPSVDVLFRSAAQHVKDNAIGIILTGMGRDGADGMRDMHDAGAQTFAQNEASCVVFGMPKEAIARGGVDEVVALPQIADQIMAYLRKI